MPAVDYAAKEDARAAAWKARGRQEIEPARLRARLGRCVAHGRRVPTPARLRRGWEGTR
jgi:hypothetical protein